MANKRELKRTINYMYGELLAECLAISLYGAKPDNQNVDALLRSILTTHGEFTSRVSHPEPSMKPKAYYKALIQDLNKRAFEIIDQIGNIS